jgi:hypothetical protein
MKLKLSRVDYSGGYATSFSIQIFGKKEKHVATFGKTKLVPYTSRDTFRCLDGCFCKVILNSPD